MLKLLNHDNLATSQHHSTQELRMGFGVTWTFLYLTISGLLLTVTLTLLYVCTVLGLWPLALCLHSAVQCCE